MEAGSSDLEMVGRHAAQRDELRAGNEFGTNAPANSQLNNPKNTCESRIAAIGWALIEQDFPERRLRPGVDPSDERPPQTQGRRMVVRLLVIGALVASMAGEVSAFQAGCSRGSFRGHRRAAARQKSAPPQLLSLRGGEQGKDGVAAEGRDAVGDNGIAKEKGMFDVLFLGSGVSVIILPGPSDLMATLRCAALRS
jgi:hypothetical protein